MSSRGSYFAGEALTWSRMDFHQRRAVTSKAVVDFLSKRSADPTPGARRKPSKTTTITAVPANIVVYRMHGSQLALVCDCIPSSLTTAAARELVGQPFLRDHRVVPTLPEAVAGPVHVIACHKGVTEAQALRQLGFPDALVVAAPFGIYVADDIQKIQMAFIAHCHDETTTHHGVQLFMQWLEQHGEDQFLLSRAHSRRRICNQISLEQRPAPPAP